MWMKAVSHISKHKDLIHAEPTRVTDDEGAHATKQHHHMPRQAQDMM
jgi:hypothetical protein